MHAALMQTLTGDADGTLDSHLGDGLPAAAVERTDYLDGRTIHHGTLAGRLTDEVDEVIVHGDSITTERVESTTQVATDFYADLDAGWAGVDSSDGVDLLEDYLRNEIVVAPEPTVLRLDAWAERLERIDGAAVWGLAYSQSVDDGYDRDRAAAKYHGDAGTHALPSAGASVVGFEYPWNGTVARGTITASGYVAIYRDWPVDTFARWVSDEVADYLEIDTDATEQSELGSQCRGCGRHTDTNEDDRCVVCADAEQRGGADA